MTHDRSPILLYDVLSAKPRAQRRLCAQRWEIPASAARMMVERMTNGGGAVRIARKIMDAGAPTLLPLLVEYGGYPLRRRPELEAEAAVLREWHFLIEDRETWRLPLDLCVAMLAVARHESFFLTTLLVRISEDELASLREEFGLAGAGSRAHQIWRLRARILADPCHGAAVEEASQRLAELGTVAVDRIDRVEYLAEGRGCLFGVTIDGEPTVLTTREVATASGYEFHEPQVTGMMPGPLGLDELDVPEWTPASGIITFASIKALKTALDNPNFRAMITEQIGDRRVVLSPECSVQDAHLALSMLGFEPNLAD